MNDLNELKQYVVAHARSQRLPAGHFESLLARIHHDGDGTEGSWVHEWTRAAERLELDGELLAACQHYNMARFPYVDGPARQEAHARSVATFDLWRRSVPGIEPLEVTLPEGRVRAWASGLSGGQRLPLLVMCGGIVSIKEQWAAVLTQMRSYGMAGVVIEMPGVGENTLPYRRDSHRMLSAVLDAVAGRADTAQTYALALSFSGHLALRAALADHRIRAVIGAGAPVHDFFTDPAWQRTVPKVTVDTLAHLTGTTSESVFDHVRDWALTDDELAAVDIPVSYVASRRDEIIPRGDMLRLKRRVRHFRVTEHDDVHGSPDHFAETQLWMLLSLLRARRVVNRQRLTLSYALTRQRLRRRLGRTPA
ncbi:alpha/beta hydrolase [Streptomyces sp. NPDC058000]|uniref:alpha/beta hydrolase n=1 Tax=Streptomyces sp. NPDC058000 TaxID=3346299 RepID=UPI0036EA5E26